MKDPLTKTVVIKDKPYKYIDKSIREKFSEFVDCLPKTVSYGKEEYYLNIWSSGGYHLSYRNKKYETALLPLNLVRLEGWDKNLRYSPIFWHGDILKPTFHFHFYNSNCDMKALCGTAYTVIFKASKADKNITHSEMTRPYSKKEEREILERQKLQLKEALKNIERQLS